MTMCSMWQIFLHFAIAALTDGCLELQLRGKRDNIGRLNQLYEETSGKEVSIDEKTSSPILRRFNSFHENMKLDTYELHGNESRQFYVLHIYDIKFAPEKGYWVPYSRGQLTASLTSDTLKALPSLTQPLQSVSMCDDNVFELVRLDPQLRRYSAPFRLIKHYDGGAEKLLCAVGSRFVRLRLTQPEFCSRYVWNWTKSLSK